MQFSRPSGKYQFHILLWIFFLLSLVSDVYTAYDRSPTRFFVYVFSKTGVIALLVYLNIALFQPLLFKPKKYVLYVLTAILLCGGVALLNTFLETYLNPGLAAMGKEVFIGQFTMALRYLLIAFLLQITTDYYRQKEVIKKMELEKTTAELNFLKAQVNPHFLFNTLNNLYALALEKSDKSPEAILKLADIMKYILAEGKEDKVALQKEIQLIGNYTELERLRKEDADIRMQVTGNINGATITPLLLLPLVENAFKYGLNAVAKNGFVNIDMAVKDSQLSLAIENNLPGAGSKAIHSLGIGIENVKKRLELLYPGKYAMEMSEGGERFKVALQLNLK